MRGWSLAGRAARFGEPRGRGIGEYVNHDQIVLLPGPYENKDEIDGRYGPERNMNLDPGGRVLEIVSAGGAWFSGRGSSDGFGSELDLIRPTTAAGADKNERDAEQKGVLYAHVVAFTNSHTRWEMFETRGAATGNGSDAFVIAALSGAEAEAGNRRRLLASREKKRNADAPRAADDAAHIDADAEFRRSARGRGGGGGDGDASPAIVPVPDANATGSAGSGSASSVVRPMSTPEVDPDARARGGDIWRDARFDGRGASAAELIARAAYLTCAFLPVFLLAVPLLVFAESELLKWGRGGDVAAAARARAALRKRAFAVTHFSISLCGAALGRH